MADVTILGAPTSAGAHYGGQELAPAAIRAAGLVEQLRRSGLDVLDAGDVPGETFRVDRSGRAARNEDAVVRVASSVADAVEEHSTDGGLLLVLGGDCTIELGVVAGLQRAHADVGLAYLDGDADLVPPDRRGSGILDATGVAHLLGIADGPLARLGAFPALAPDRLVLLGYDAGDPDSFDAAALAARPELVAIEGTTLGADPDAAVARAGRALAGVDAVAVHLDVDAVDSGDLPLANFPHYGLGSPLATISRAAEGLVALPGVVALTVTEVNPTHDPGGRELDRFVREIVQIVAAWYSAKTQ